MSAPRPEPPPLAPRRRARTAVDALAGAADVTYRIVYLIDPRKKPKGPARHTLLSCLQQHLRFAGLRPVKAENAPGRTEPEPQRPMGHAYVAGRAPRTGRFTVGRGGASPEAIAERIRRFMVG